MLLASCSRLTTGKATTKQIRNSQKQQNQTPKRNHYKRNKNQQTQKLSRLRNNKLKANKSLWVKKYRNNKNNKNIVIANTMMMNNHNIKVYDR